MKRILLLILTVAMLVCAVPHMAFAANTTINVNGLTYELNASTHTATLTDGKNASSKEVVIPNKVNGNYDVTTIGDDAFLWCTELTSVTIPDSVESIGNHTFSECRRLGSVTIGKGVKTIGKSAFSNCCWALKSVDIPDNVESIGDWAFSKCESLKSITISGRETTIGDHAFSVCWNLNSITIPSDFNKEKFKDRGITVDENDENVFTNNIYGESGHFNYIFNKGNLTYKLDSETKKAELIDGKSATGDVNIPDKVNYNEKAYKVTTIGEGAFYYCKSLTSITIGKGVKTIGKSAFYHCWGLEPVVIPDNVESIGDYVFSGCSGLKSVKIHNRDNFTYELNLQTKEAILIDASEATGAVEIPATVSYGEIEYSVTAIGNDAFCGCSGLESVKMIHNRDSFTYELNLQTQEAILIDASEATGAVEIPATVSYGGIEYSVTTIGDNAFSWKSLVFYNLSVRWSFSLESVIIPDSVTTIGDNAFSECRGLKSITIGKGVESIGYGAFANCSSLESITIPNSVETIGGSAFQGCGKLKSVTIGKGVKRICKDAFKGCESLTSVTIGKGVKRICKDAFKDCESLMSITIPSDFHKKKFMDTGITVGKDDNNTFTILCDMFDSYGQPGRPSQQGHFNYIFNKDNLTYKLDSKTNKAELIDGTSATGDVNIPATVSYGEIEYSVTAIGDKAFFDCKNLTSVKIPKGVTTIGSYTFYKCSDLASMTIPDSVKSIGKGAFFWCGKLKSITIPKGFAKSTFKGTNITVNDINTPIKEGDTFTNSGCGSGRFVLSYDEGGSNTTNTLAAPTSLTSLTSNTNNNVVNNSSRPNLRGEGNAARARGSHATTYNTYSNVSPHLTPDNFRWRLV